MIAKTIILLLLLFASITNQYSYAEQHTTLECDSTYTVPSSTRDTIITGDSIVVIHTVCAPICSSHARVYNKEWKEIGVLKAPFKSAFPEAYIEEGKILWRDNDTLDYTPAP